MNKYCVGRSIVYPQIASDWREMARDGTEWHRWEFRGTNLGNSCSVLEWRTVQVLEEMECRDGRRLHDEFGIAHCGDEQHYWHEANNEVTGDREANEMRCDRNALQTRVATQSARAVGTSARCSGRFRAVQLEPRVPQTSETGDQRQTESEKVFVINGSYLSKHVYIIIN